MQIAIARSQANQHGFKMLKKNALKTFAKLLENVVVQQKLLAVNYIKYSMPWRPTNLWVSEFKETSKPKVAAIADQNLKTQLPIGKPTKDWLIVVCENVRKQIGLRKKIGFSELSVT